MPSLEAVMKDYSDKMNNIQKGEGPITRTLNSFFNDEEMVKIWLIRLLNKYNKRFTIYLTIDEIKALFAYTDEIYLKFGASDELTGLNYANEIQQMQDKAHKENLDLIYFPIRHLGTERSLNVLKNK